MKDFTKKVIQYSNHETSLNTEDDVEVFLLELGDKLRKDFLEITGDENDAYESYKFLQKPSFAKYSKFDLAELIAQQIGFPFDPLMDMGKANGVISINYLKKFIDIDMLYNNFLVLIFSS